MDAYAFFSRPLDQYVDADPADETSDLGRVRKSVPLVGQHAAMAAVVGSDLADVEAQVSTLRDATGGTAALYPVLGPGGPVKAIPWRAAKRFPMEAAVLMDVHDRPVAEVAQQLSDLSTADGEVLGSARIAGGPDLLLRVGAHDAAGLHRLVRRDIAGTPGVRGITTHLVAQEEPTPPSAPTLSKGAGG